MLLGGPKRSGSRGKSHSLNQIVMADSDSFTANGRKKYNAETFEGDENVMEEKEDKEQDDGGKEECER